MEPRETTGERLLAELLGARNSNQSTITINAGGIGVWISTTACMVMLAALLVAAFWVSREFNRIDSRFNDQTDVDSVQDAYIHKLRAEQPKKEKP